MSTSPSLRSRLGSSLIGLSLFLLAACGDKSVAATSTTGSGAGARSSAEPPESSAASPARAAGGAAGLVTMKAGAKATDLPIEKAFVVDSTPTKTIVLLSGCPAATCKEAHSFKSLEALCKDRKAVEIVVEQRPDAGPLKAAKLGKDTSPKAWVRITHLSPTDPDLFFPEAAEITSSDESKLAGKLLGELPAAPSTTYDFRETGLKLLGSFEAEVCPAE